MQLLLLFFLLAAPLLQADTPRPESPTPLLGYHSDNDQHKCKGGILSLAKQYLGTKYSFGSKNKNRIDCSAFTQQVFAQIGIKLPRSAVAQSRLGKKIGLNELQIGDLLFFRTYKKAPSHVAIYAGKGRIIHASYAAGKVQFDSIEKGYYRRCFLFARRFSIPDDTPES